MEKGGTPTRTTDQGHAEGGVGNKLLRVTLRISELPGSAALAWQWDRFTMDQQYHGEEHEGKSVFEGAFFLEQGKVHRHLSRGAPQLDARGRKKEEGDMTWCSNRNPAVWRVAWPELRQAMGGHSGHHMPGEDRVRRAPGH